MNPGNERLKISRFGGRLTAFPIRFFSQVKVKHGLGFVHGGAGGGGDWVITGFQHHEMRKFQYHRIEEVARKSSFGIFVIVTLIAGRTRFQ